MFIWNACQIGWKTAYVGMYVQSKTVADSTCDDHDEGWEIERHIDWQVSPAPFINPAYAKRADKEAVTEQ